MRYRVGTRRSFLLQMRAGSGRDRADSRYGWRSDIYRHIHQGEATVSDTEIKRVGYKIDNGETIRVPMIGGIHGVTFRCGIRNKVIQLEVAQNLNLNLRWNRLTGSLIVK